MSHGPSTFGAMTTSSTSPISATSVVTSSSAHGYSSAFTRLDRVDAPPQRGVAEVHLAADADEPLARGYLAIDRDGVLEVAEEDVAARREVGQLRRHLLVRRVEEVDHPRRLRRDVEDRRRRADRQGLREVAGVAHGGDDIDWQWSLTWARGLSGGRWRRLARTQTRRNPSADFKGRGHSQAVISGRLAACVLAWVTTSRGRPVLTARRRGAARSPRRAAGRSPRTR